MPYSKVIVNAHASNENVEVIYFDSDYELIETCISCWARELLFVHQTEFFKFDFLKR